MQSVAEFRHHMIDGQLEPNRVLSPLIVSAMGVVGREAFVPESYRQSAYLDEMIPLGNHRYMLSPLLIGQMLQALDPKSGEKILVMGDGTGYCPALLAQMGCKTYMLEESQELSNRARLTLNQLGVSSVEVHTGPLEMGLNAAKPFDKIIIKGAVDRTYQCWQDQLTEGGTLCYVTVRSQLPMADMARGSIVTLTRGVDGQMIESVHDDVSCPVIASLTQKGGFCFD